MRQLVRQRGESFDTAAEIKKLKYRNGVREGDPLTIEIIIAERQWRHQQINQ